MKKVLKVLTNKYLLTAAAFIAWSVYFDQNDFLSLQQHQKELKAVKDNIAYLDGEIAKMNAEKTALLNDPRKLEQYARENYRMKHEGEDVYVIDNASPGK